MVGPSRGSGSPTGRVCPSEGLRNPDQRESHVVTLQATRRRNGPGNSSAACLSERPIRQRRSNQRTDEAARILRFGPPSVITIHGSLDVYGDRLAVISPVSADDRVLQDRGEPAADVGPRLEPLPRPEGRPCEHRETERRNEVYRCLNGVGGFRRELQLVLHACEIGQG